MTYWPDPPLQGGCTVSTLDPTYTITPIAEVLG